MSMSLTVPQGNSIYHFAYHVTYLNKPVTVCSTYQIDQLSIDYRFACIALGAIDAYITDTSDRPVIDLDKINIILSDSDSVSFVDHFDAHACTCGSALIAAVCNVQRMKSLGFSDLQMSAVLVEEIVHIAYAIWDETAVKQKVVSILNQYYGTLTLQSLYSSFPGKPNFT